MPLESAGQTVQEQAEKLSVVPSHFAIYCFIFAKRKAAADECQIYRLQPANEQCRSMDHTKEDAVRPHLKEPCTYHDHDEMRKSELAVTGAGGGARLQGNGTGRLAVR